MSDARPSFSVLVPAFNEAAHIEECLEMLLSQIPDGEGELILIDGGSSDETLAIARRMAERHAQLRVVSNPGRIQSIGCNLGARLAAPSSTVLIRADAHASYPLDFIELCLTTLVARDATSVVVPMRTLGRAPMQRAIAASQNSVLGNGGSRHRRSGSSGYVEHGHHAAFKRRFFESIGGYDETFTHNEDAEFDVRALAASGRIWLCNEAIIGYFPRSDLPSLARQYRRHGSGRARTVFKHHHRMKLRQLLPIGVLGSVLIAPLGILSPVIALPLVLYLALCSMWSVALAARHRDVALLATGSAALVMHVSWSIGFLETAFILTTRALRRAGPLKFPFCLPLAGRSNSTQGRSRR